MEYDKPIEMEWVIGCYYGDQARSKKALADNGVAYFVRSEQGRGDNYEIEVAFLRPTDTPRPEHLLLADNSQARKLNALYDQRHGIREEQRTSNDSSNNSNKSELGSIIRAQGLRAYYDKLRANKLNQ
jgi:hypothetical protein